MKKLISLFLVLVMVVAMAAPVMALPTTGTTKSGNGRFIDADGFSYNYSYSAFASPLKAQASLSYDRSATKIGVMVDVIIDTSQGIKYKSGSNAGNETVSTTVTRTLLVNGETLIGAITKSEMKFLIATEKVKSVTLS